MYQEHTGILSIVATPIGNLQDITLRALETLKTVDLILAEDTRQTGKLLHHFEITTPMLPFHDFNEYKKTGEVIEKLKNGLNIALVSDAGTPLVSDPGYKLVRAAIAEGLKVTTLPGPSAAIAALTISGLPPDKFLFVGFLPEKPGKRRTMLEHLIPHCHSERSDNELKNLNATIIIYESPHHLKKTLAEMLEVFGNIPIVICCELTKIHEEAFQGTIEECLAHFQAPKGEFVILL